MNKINYYLIRLLDKSGILEFVNFRVSVNINQSKFYIPFRGSKMGTENLLLAEAWFFSVYNKLRPLIKDDYQFVDIGMNIGQTLLKVRSIDKQIPYIGFEPNPVCVSYLYKLVQVNKIKNIRIIPVGLGSQAEILTLYADNEFASGASVIKGFRKKQKIKWEYNIPVFNGDEILNNLKIGLIKIDVEGFELDVLKGIINSIKLNRPFILCEILPNYNNRDSERYIRQIELESLLKSNDYSIGRLDEKSAKFKLLNSIDIFDSMDESNYIFIPNERLEDVSELLIK
jgi:FkbM family methyltransferase